MSDLATEIGQGGVSALTPEQAQFASDAAALAQQTATGTMPDGSSIPRTASPGLFSSFSASLSKAKQAVVTPFQTMASSAARSAGATAEQSEIIGSGFLPVLLIAAAVAVVVYCLKFRSRNVTA